MSSFRDAPSLRRAQTQTVLSKQAHSERKSSLPSPPQINHLWFGYGNISQGSRLARQKDILDWSHPKTNKAHKMKSLCLEMTRMNVKGIIDLIRNNKSMELLASKARLLIQDHKTKEMILLASKHQTYWIDLIRKWPFQKSSQICRLGYTQLCYVFPGHTLNNLYHKTRWYG